MTHANKAAMINKRRSQIHMRDFLRMDLPMLRSLSS